MARPELCVSAVVVHAGRLLLVRRANGHWAVPGGRVEERETLCAAVERELAEETGLSVDCGLLLGIAERISSTSHQVILSFLASTGDPQTLRAGDDAAEAGWFELSEVPGIDLVEGMADFLRRHGIIAGH